jgi:hypothetical protein
MPRQHPWADDLALLGVVFPLGTKHDKAVLFPGCSSLVVSVPISRLPSRHCADHYQIDR